MSLIQELLAYMTQNPREIKTIDLPIETIADPIYQNVWSTLLDMAEKNVTPTHSLLEASNVPDDVVEELFDSDTKNVNKYEYASRIRETFARDQMSQSLRILANRFTTDPQYKLIDVLRDASQLQERIQGYLLGDDLGETLLKSQITFFNELDEEKEDPKNKIRLPWPALQASIPSLMPGNLLSVLADPGGGKTAFLEFFAEYAAQEGFNVVYVNLELPQKTMRQRRMQRHSGVTQLEQDAPHKLTEVQQQLLEAADSKISKWPGNIQYVYAPGATMAQIESLVERIDERRPWTVNEKGVDIVLLDYLNMVEMEGEGASGIEAAIQQFKNMLGRNGWVGALAAQFDKASIGRTGNRRLSNALGTSALDHKSNVGIIIDRSFDETTGRLNDAGYFSVVKVNAGIPQRYPVVYKGKHLLFSTVK